MELLLYSVLLYAWQCLVTIPTAGLVLIPLAGTCLTVRGPGIKAFSPWPGSRTLAAGGYPLELGEGSVHTESPKHFLGGGSLVPDPRSRPLASGETWTARGTALIHGTGAFFRTVSKAHASHLAAFLGKLKDSTPDARAEIVAAELDAAFDLAACRRDFREARRCTRVLRWTCDLYGVAVFGLLPGLLIFRDGEAVWLALFPVILFLHAIGVGALLLASRGLGESPSDRFERVLVGALYPPALLRGSVDLVNDRLARFHPVTVATIMLGKHDLRRLLQIVRAEYTHPVWRRHEPYAVPEQAEREAFLAQLKTRVEALARELDIDLPPVRQDPSAATFCPLCLCDYRPGFGACAACGVPTQPYAGDESIPPAILA